MKNIKQKITMISACLLVTLVMAGESTNAPVFQLRLVVESRFEDASSGGSNEFALLQVDRRSGKTNAEVLLLEKTILLDHTGIERAEAATNRASGRPEISITFTEEGRKRFADVTRKNIGKRLAILIDGKVQSAPVIRSEIPGGKALITGSFTPEEASSLSRKIHEASASSSIK
jgi:preprotein translocase subunit SecD